jgi:hydrogenase nickel incorporation protein HypB
MFDIWECDDPKVLPAEAQMGNFSGEEGAPRHNRGHFEAAGVFAVNLMGSPGSGKTAVLEATARAGSGLRIGAMSGSLATERDTERLRAAGVPTVPITTGAACHLDAELVDRALHTLEDWFTLDLLFIENVGNLVTRAVFDLGQAANIVVLSVTEGEDKPIKYPVMFRKADLVLITKIDLLPHLPGMSLPRLLENLSCVMPDPRTILLSATTGVGLSEWLGWLQQKREARAVMAGAVSRC